MQAFPVVATHSTAAPPSPSPQPANDRSASSSSAPVTVPAPPTWPAGSGMASWSKQLRSATASTASGDAAREFITVDQLPGDLLRRILVDLSATGGTSYASLKERAKQIASMQRVKKEWRNYLDGQVPDSASLRAAVELAAAADRERIRAAVKALCESRPPAAQLRTDLASLLHGQSNVEIDLERIPAGDMIEIVQQAVINCTALETLEVHAHNMPDMADMTASFLLEVEERNQALRYLKLDLSDANHSHDTFEKLLKLRSLRALILDAGRLNGTVIPILSRLTALDTLSIRHNLFSIDEIMTLRAALPKTAITADAIPTRRKLIFQ